jgi:hypothetical protein
MVDSTRGQRAAQTASTEAVPTTLRRKRASVGGLKLKLEAPKREGYVRRFVLNDPSRILAMQELGYQFADADTRTDGLGTRIERHAGKDENGAPQRLVLMETPESEYRVGVAEKEEALKPFEQALRAGRDTTGKLQDTYETAERSSIS